MHGPINIQFNNGLFRFYKKYVQESFKMNTLSSMLLSITPENKFKFRVSVLIFILQ